MSVKKEISSRLRFKKSQQKVSLSPSGYIISDPKVFTNTNEYMNVIEKFAKWESLTSSKKSK